MNLINYFTQTQTNTNPSVWFQPEDMRCSSPKRPSTKLFITTTRTHLITINRQIALFTNASCAISTSSTDRDANFIMNMPWLTECCSSSRFRLKIQAGRLLKMRIKYVRSMRTLERVYRNCEKRGSVWFLNLHRRQWHSLNVRYKFWFEWLVLRIDEGRSIIKNLNESF